MYHQKFQKIVVKRPSQKFSIYRWWKKLGYMRKEKKAFDNLANEEEGNF